MLTPGQVANGAAAGFTALAGLIFITSYALSARWWKSLEGRLMMLLGGAISMTCLLTLSLTIVGFHNDDDWLRFIQATLVIAVGGCFIYYTIMVWKLQKRGSHRTTTQKKEDADA